MPGRISDGSREPQMVAVPPPEFWHSIRQEVAWACMGRSLRHKTDDDYVDPGPDPLMYENPFFGDWEGVWAPVRPLDPTESPVILQHGALNAFEGLDGAWSEDEFYMWKTCAGEDWGDADERELHARGGACGELRIREGPALRVFPDGAVGRPLPRPSRG